jgi:hypothetical protein
VSAHSAGAYTATLLVMANVMKKHEEDKIGDTRLNLLFA